MIGFDIDLAGLIAKRLDLQLSIVNLDLDLLIPAVVNGEADIAMAALASTRSRKQKVDFSNIYYRSRHALVSLEGYLRSRDLGYQTLGIRKSSVQARYANDLRKDLPNLDIMAYDTLSEAFSALEQGQVEGLIVEAHISERYLGLYPAYQAQIIPSDEPTGCAIALAKNSPLRRDINTALADIKASGEMEQLINRWFD
ncbi:MAG: amino acid ABC transporter substrate-binding protein [Phormidesmis sp. RL_2_1]|nr:amino acid ABC transporter substrate-binding protein [Phormidesmis sp. RL_2_1]